MNSTHIKTFIIKKINEHSKKNIYFLRMTLHLFFFILSKKYRKNRCLIDVPVEILYKFKVLAKLLYIPTYFFSKYLKKRKIFISINNPCNWSVGHIYAEIGQLKRMQEIDVRFSNSIIWFPTTRKEILGEGKDIFEDDNFKIIFGGIKYIFLNLIALNNKSVTIDGSLGHFNLYGEKNHSHRYVYNNKHKKYGKIIANTSGFYPVKKNLDKFDNRKIKLFNALNIQTKYIVLQLKQKKTNGTLKPLDPNLLLETIKYFQKKNYQVIFAGRENFPDAFLNKSIIDYSNSKYKSVLNDYILIANSSLIISSASGFASIPENLDKPLLIINGHHLNYLFFRRSIYLPTLFSRKSKNFDFKKQFSYLCTYGPEIGFTLFDDFFILHIPTSKEILMAAKELENMINKNIPPLTYLQKKFANPNNRFYSPFGLGRYSDYYLNAHKIFFNL